MSRTRGRIIALISLIAYALHSPVMQWGLGITMPFGVGFTDFTGCFTCGKLTNHKDCKFQFHIHHHTALDYNF